MKKFDIEQRRKELGLTLEQVGKAVGVSKSTVKKWETGYINNMKRDKIALLAKVLQVSPLEFIDIPDNAVITAEQLSELNSGFAAFSNRIKKITPHELEHTERYRQLNDIGQQKADEYIDDLLENPKYTVGE